MARCSTRSTPTSLSVLLEVFEVRYIYIFFVLKIGQAGLSVAAQEESCGI